MSEIAIKEAQKLRSYYLSIFIPAVEFLFKPVQYLRKREANNERMSFEEVFFENFNARSLFPSSYIFPPVKIFEEEKTEINLVDRKGMILSCSGHRTITACFIIHELLKSLPKVTQQYVRGSSNEEDVYSVTLDILEVYCTPGGDKIVDVQFPILEGITEERRKELLGKIEVFR